MKGRLLTWEQFQEQDPKQTAVLVTYYSPTIERFKTPFTRVLLGGFSSREDAWEWCKDSNTKNRVIYKGNDSLQMTVKLLKLSKLIREYTETAPERVSAIRLS